MNKYLLDPEVCPSSLNEKDEPVTEGETAHKYDLDTGLCAECGATMTKKAKLTTLEKAMTQSERNGDENDTFYHFTDEAPEALKDLYLEHYNVQDIDYEIFSQACDIVSEIYADMPEADDEKATDNIYECSSGSASVYTSSRLAYLTGENEDEISDTMREYGEHSIANACAIWYDRQVEQAAVIIKDWVNA